MGKTKQILFDLIEQRLQPGANIAELDEKIWSMFGETWAVLCSDMTGFTRRTDEFGIIHFLTLIYEMQKLLKPIVLAYNGLLIKTEADNLFVIFREPAQAVHCALAMHDATLRYNEGKTADYKIMVCIGIGYGKLVKIGDEDCFGNEVNRAFKLGEDIANAGETLLTPDTYEAIKAQFPDRKFIQENTDKTGLVNRYYRLQNGD
jgi:adenylate cyclase